MTDKVLRWNPLTMTAGDLNKLAQEVYTLKMYLDRMRTNGDREVDEQALAAHTVQMLDGWTLEK